MYRYSPFILISMLIITYMQQIDKIMVQLIPGKP
jgi:hypothetical protein